MMNMQACRFCKADKKNSHVAQDSEARSVQEMEELQVHGQSTSGIEVDKDPHLFKWNSGRPMTHYVMFGLTLGPDDTAALKFGLWGGDGGHEAAVQTFLSGLAAHVGVRVGPMVKGR